MKSSLVRVAGVGLLGLALLISLQFGLGAQQAGTPQVVEELEPIVVEGQPLASNVQRLIQALEFLGAPLPAETKSSLQAAGRARDARKIQQLLDPRVLFVVSLNPEVRVKVTRGPAASVLRQSGFTPFLVKVINESTTTQPLRITSPQSGPVYAGVAKLSMERERQEHLRENENVNRDDRFLQVEMFSSPPMTANLSGLEVEYALALVYSSEAGQREAIIGFDVGQGNQDLGFRGELPVLFTIRPAVPVRLSIRDHDGKPTTGRFTFFDRSGHVYPPQVKRLAPDLFFQKQIYRHDGDTVLLPPGEFKMFYGRGPEYRWLERMVTVSTQGKHTIQVQLERWVHPMAYGYYSGDHHIHAAGCAHYMSPTEGVLPSDMFLQVRGEGLNVGSILTWGPGFNYQRQFFSQSVDRISEPYCLMKYDIEVSGFGSEALGHVCLLNLKEQVYRGADGIRGWPTWTTPVLRWAKAQGAVTGYAHSGSGLQVNPAAAAKRLMAELDSNKDERIGPNEASGGLLPNDLATIDLNQDGAANEAELVKSLDRVADQLPNLAVPELNSVGAQEIFVTTALGVCDFISAMDTARLLEWNCWYHLLNCGFPLKAAGETDFPCMSGTRVGQGRSYVQLGKVDRIDYKAWSEGLARGRSYVSDGYAHALQFTVSGKSAGDEVSLSQPDTVKICAKVAFSSQTPLEVAYGGVFPARGKRLIGDTVNFHEPLSSADSTPLDPRLRLVELVVNGQAVASKKVPADDRLHELEFSVRVDRSSWVAVRHFPQMHTNPVNVLIGGQPIRASRKSALWCIAAIEQLWRARNEKIAAHEREEARQTFWSVIDRYRQIAKEAAGGT
ncbi:MAG: CehA/McbA family metallohydrolase [Acidobacteria bacterium]|nr:CehA/McbA family metallohydrolase [Acidobacteriota bacterium]